MRVPLRWRREGVGPTAAAVRFLSLLLSPLSSRSSELWECGNPARGWRDSHISTALRLGVRPQSRGAAGDSSFTARNNTALAWRIFCPDAVSLIRRARRSRDSKLMPGLRNFSAWGSDFSFS